MGKRQRKELVSSESKALESSVETKLMSMAKRIKRKIDSKQNLSELLDSSDIGNALGKPSDTDSTIEKLDNPNHQRKENKKVALQPENGTENQNPKDPTQSEGTTISNELPKHLTSDVQNSGAITEKYIDPKERSKERKINMEIKRTGDTRNNAMALLKAQREGKQKRDEKETKRQPQIEEKGEKEQLKSFNTSEVYSDSGSGRTPSNDKPTPSSCNSKCSSSKSENKASIDQRPRFINSKEELDKIRLSRFQMEKLINLPIFERTVLNCFVRINIGNNTEQKPVYRVAEIVGVVGTSRIYYLGNVLTNKSLRLKHGAQERVFSLQFISNQAFTESEFTKWRVTCMEENVGMPLKDLVEKKIADVEAALNYDFKDKNVNKIKEEISYY